MSKGYFIVHREQFKESSSVLITPIYKDMGDSLITDVEVLCNHIDTGEPFTVNSYLVKEDLIVPDAFMLVSKEDILALDHVVSITELAKVEPVLQPTSGLRI